MSHNLHKGIHGASEANGVLKPSGTEGTIWAQVQGHQDTTVVQEALPCGLGKGGQFGLEEAPESGGRHPLAGHEGAEIASRTSPRPGESWRRR